MPAKQRRLPEMEAFFVELQELIIPEAASAIILF
jgi:hypothetical protein